MVCNIKKFKCREGVVCIEVCTADWTNLLNPQLTLKLLNELSKNLIFWNSKNTKLYRNCTKTQDSRTNRKSKSFYGCRTNKLTAMKITAQLILMQFAERDRSTGLFRRIALKDNITENVIKDVFVVHRGVR